MTGLPTDNATGQVWSRQMRLLSAGLGGLALGVVVYAMSGVVWRCIVIALVGGVSTWFITGSLSISGHRWPARINNEANRRTLDLWRVQALGVALVDPTYFRSRLRPRLLALAKQSLAARNIDFDSTAGRQFVGDRVHDILTEVGPPPERGEVRTVVQKVTSMNEDSGSGGVRTLEAIISQRMSRSGNSRRSTETKD